MNNQPYVPPEVRGRLSANLKKTEEEMKEIGKSLDKLLAHLDAQIASQRKRTKQTLPQN